MIRVTYLMAHEIARLRVAKQLTQKALAEAAGMVVERLENIERHRTKRLKPEEFERLQKVLGPIPRDESAPPPRRAGATMEHAVTVLSDGAARRAAVAEFCKLIAGWDDATRLEALRAFNHAHGLPPLATDDATETPKTGAARPPPGRGRKVSGLKG